MRKMATLMSDETIFNVQGPRKKNNERTGPNERREGDREKRNKHLENLDAVDARLGAIVQNPPSPGDN